METIKQYFPCFFPNAGSSSSSAKKDNKKKPTRTDKQASGCWTDVRMGTLDCLVKRFNTRWQKSKSNFWSKGQNRLEDRQIKEQFSSNIIDGELTEAQQEMIRQHKSLSILISSHSLSHSASPSLLRGRDSFESSTKDSPPINTRDDLAQQSVRDLTSDESAIMLDEQTPSMHSNRRDSGIYVGRESEIVEEDASPINLRERSTQRNRPVASLAEVLDQEGFKRQEDELSQTLSMRSNPEDRGVYSEKGKTDHFKTKQQPSLIQSMHLRCEIQCGLFKQANETTKALIEEAKRYRNGGQIIPSQLKVNLEASLKQLAREMESYEPHAVEAQHQELLHAREDAINTLEKQSFNPRQFEFILSLTDTIDSMASLIAEGGRSSKNIIVIKHLLSEQDKGKGKSEPSHRYREDSEISHQEKELYSTSSFCAPGVGDAEDTPKISTPAAHLKEDEISSDNHRRDSVGGHKDAKSKITGWVFSDDLTAHWDFSNRANFSEVVNLIADKILSNETNLTVGEFLSTFPPKKVVQKGQANVSTPKNAQPVFSDDLTAHWDFSNRANFSELVNLIAAEILSDETNLIVGKLLSNPEKKVIQERQANANAAKDGQSVESLLKKLNFLNEGVEESKKRLKAFKNINKQLGLLLADQRLPHRRSMLGDNFVPPTLEECSQLIEASTEMDLSAYVTQLKTLKKAAKDKVEALEGNTGSMDSQTREAVESLNRQIENIEFILEDCRWIRHEVRATTNMLKVIDRKLDQQIDELTPPQEKLKKLMESFDSQAVH